MIGEEGKYSWGKFLDCAIEHKLCLVNWRVKTFVPGLPASGKTWKWTVLPVGPVKDMVNSIESGNLAPHFEPWSDGKVKFCLPYKPHSDLSFCDRPEKVAHIRPRVS